MYAPCGDSVSGAVVLGSGRGKRGSSAPCPAPSLVRFPRSPPRQGREKRHGERVPQTLSFSMGGPRQPHTASGASSPSHDSPHVLLPELGRRKRGSSHVGPSVYVPGDPPLQERTKKKARARAGWQEGKDPRGARAQASHSRAHACRRLADVAPGAQEFPGHKDF